MPRINRIVATGLAHHVTHRGNNQEIIFVDDHDRLYYLFLLKEYAQKFDSKIWAYCLMSNHIHLIAVPEKEDSLAKTIGSLHTRYAVYFNVKRGRSGHLWQGRFYSSILADEKYQLAAVRYVERNPVRAGMCNKAQEYAWSSARAHVFGEPNLTLSQCPLVDEICDWSDYLASEDDTDFVHSLRMATFTGKAIGTEVGLVGLKKRVGMDLSLKPMGRPKKGTEVAVTI